MSSWRDLENKYAARGPIPADDPEARQRVLQEMIDWVSELEARVVDPYRRRRLEPYEIHWAFDEQSRRGSNPHTPD